MAGSFRRELGVPDVPSQKHPVNWRPTCRFRRVVVQVVAQIRRRGGGERGSFP